MLLCALLPKEKAETVPLTVGELPCPKEKLWPAAAVLVLALLPKENPEVASPGVAEVACPKEMAGAWAAAEEAVLPKPNEGPF